MSDHDRCGCDESAALRRELEAGTPAMYRARLRDAERARDELAAEVERRVREHAALVETAQKALAETERERDEARADAASWLGQYEGAATDVSRLLRERDEARSEVGRLTAILDAMRGDVDLAGSAVEWERQCAEVREDAIRYGRERDEARAQFAALRESARAALRDLVDALPLDDRPRTEAIRRARETLARWGMR